MRNLLTFCCLAIVSFGTEIVGAPVRLAAGSTPLPPYRLDRRLGQTGTTEVWRATRQDGSALALKFVAVDPGSARTNRAIGEVRVMLALRDVRIDGLLVAETAWAVEGYLVFPMVLADDTLGALQQRAGSGLPPGELLPAMASVAATLDRLSAVREWRGRPVRGLVHRDVKPENIFFLNGHALLGDLEWTVPLTAFGVRSATPAGTPGYAAPEFFHGETTVRSDQFSLAATYVAMRLGRFPFPSVPIAFEGGWKPGEPRLEPLGPREQDVLKRALATDPTRRFESCGAFVEALGLAADR